MFGALYLARLYGYLLFHSFVEVFSILVAGGIFMVAWNARRFLDCGYFVVLGVAFLFIGFIDLLHTLAYQGMGVLRNSSANLSSQLWVAGRLVQASSFAVAPLFLRRPVRPAPLWSAYAGSVGLLLGAILWWNWFPDCYVAGRGVTLFKTWAEYLICLVLLYALWRHWQERSALDRSVLGLIATSLLVTVASELAFTHYVDVYGPANAVGHCLKVIAFFLIYRAFVEVALSKPYRLLFLDLKRSHERMRESQARLEVVNRDLRASMQQLAEDETAARGIQFVPLPPRRLLCRGCEFQSSLHTSTYLSGDFVDYFPVDQERLGFYIADVSGHGVSSAFITVLLKSTMAHFLEEYQQGREEIILHPDQVMGCLNSYFLQQRFGKYLTMFYALLNTSRSHLSYSNAGQFPPPILIDEQGGRFLEQKSMPIGLFAQAVYRTIDLSVGPHFRLALFSDGVLELLPQPDVRSKREFLLTQVSSVPADLDHLEAALGIRDVRAPVDDLTVLLLKAA